MVRLGATSFDVVAMVVYGHEVGEGDERVATFVSGSSRVNGSRNDCVAVGSVVEVAVVEDGHG